MGRAAARAARPRIALALSLLAGLTLAACNSQANRPIPVASAADLAASTAAAATQSPEPVAAEASAPDASGAELEPTTTAALPGDAAAAEDAELPEAETYATAAPADPDEVMGLDRGEVEALLGEPGLVRREAPAEVWQYESRGCVLDVFLYEASADFEVVYIEARNGQAVTAAAATCLGSVMDQRRSTPTS